MKIEMKFKPHVASCGGVVWHKPVPAALALALVAGLGLGASAASANGLLGGGSIAGVSATIGGGSLANVGVNVGGLQAGASVLGGGSVAKGCVGNCGTTGTTPTTGGVTVGVTVGGTTPGTTTPGTTTPGTPTPPVTTVSTPGTPGAIPRKVIPASALHCAGAGNSAVYNGYPVVDRNGVLAGWVHDTRLSTDLKIEQVQFETLSKNCVSLSGGGIKAAGYQMRVNIDRTAMP